MNNWHVREWGVVSPEDPSIDWSVANVPVRVRPSWDGGAIVSDCKLDEMCLGSIERRRCLE